MSVRSEPFTVHTYEVDLRGRASIQALCGYLQDAAGRQADELGLGIPRLMQENLTWVLARLLVRVSRYPGWWEELTVDTWPVGFHRLFALRDWQVYRGRELLAQATSAWLMVQVASRRPVRPADYGDWTGAIQPQRAVPLTLGKLPELPGPAAAAGQCAEFTVRYRDLDLNRHANNISYLDWLLECLPAELRGGRHLAELEVDFLGELGPGDCVLSRAAPLESAAAPADPAAAAVGPQRQSFLHSLSRSSDGREVARARTLWTREP